MAVIGGFRSDLSITCKTDGNIGNVSVGVLFSKVAYQRKWWQAELFILQIISTGVKIFSELLAEFVGKS